MFIFEKALLLDKKNKSTILNLARLNLNLGDIKKSEIYYNSLLDIEPISLLSNVPGQPQMGVLIYSNWNDNWPKATVVIQLWVHYIAHLH